MEKRVGKVVDRIVNQDEEVLRRIIEEESAKPEGKINQRFLVNVVKNVDSHNKREEEENCYRQYRAEKEADRVMLTRRKRPRRGMQQIQSAQQESDEQMRKRIAEEKGRAMKKIRMEEEFQNFNPLMHVLTRSDTDEDDDDDEQQARDERKRRRKADKKKKKKKKEKKKKKKKKDKKEDSD